MSKLCEYYLSPHSPFSYLGHTHLVALAKQHGVQIVLKPFDLSKVFGISGGVPLAKRAPQRQAYRLKELARWAAFRDLPMNVQPTYFPVQSDAASKLIIATQLALGTESALMLAGAVMRGIWAEERNIADPETLKGIAVELGHDGRNLLKSSETASVQAEFDRFTDEAMEANIFGAPWYVVDGEPFWGQDRLDFVERVFVG
jgi:2-hydroxychromene-2-carboxylate isomerase